MHAIEPTDCVSRDAGRMSRSTFQDITRDLDGLDSTAIIGQFDGPDEYIFARVSDLDIDRRGNIVVADARGRTVRVFDRAGAFVQTIGEAGEGPGEFRSPGLVALDSAGRLYVEDGRLRLQRFHVVNGQYEYLDQVRLEISVEDFCIMRDTLYVQGWRLGESPADSAIHKYALDGQHVQSFGQIFAHDDDFFVGSYTRGRLACIAPLDAIAYVPKQVPAEVRLYRSTGALWWITTLPETESMVFAATQTGHSMSLPETGAHWWLTLSHVDGRFLLMQRFFSVQGNRDAYREESFVFDGRTGHGRFIGDTLPQLTFADGTVPLGVLRDPFPAIVIYR
jgi:6-bladed beta-propeller